jgi:eukaryotic-like serine/threonine-protein kinase
MSLRRLLAVLALVGVSLVGLVMVADFWLLPWLVHHQSEVLVPDILGATQEEAESRLRDVGLGIFVYDEIYDIATVPGTVVEQNPSPLRAVRRGRRVRVMVSKGEALLRVPDLTGLSQRQSELSLLREGLRVGHVARSFDPKGVLGVVSQRPHPGREVLRDTPVDLLVREGVERAEYRMPSLVGAGLSRVRSRLEGAGFEIRRVTSREVRGTRPGIVVDQWPPAGSRIPRGGSIELVAASSR